jgi:hypothetical protein
MKKLIKSFKARIVSFCQRPIKKLKLKFVCYVEEVVNREVNDYVTSADKYVDMDRRLDSLEENAVEYDGFNSALWDDYDFTSLDDKVEKHESKLDNLEDLILQPDAVKYMIRKEFETIMTEKFTIEVTFKPKE